MPSRTSPHSWPASARSVSCNCSVSCSQLRSRSAARAPSGVSVTPRPVRRSKGPPRDASNSLICRLMCDCTVCRRAATLLMLPASETSRKSLTLGRCMVITRLRYA